MNKMWLNFYFFTQVTFCHKSNYIFCFFLINLNQSFPRHALRLIQQASRGLQGAICEEGGSGAVILIIYVFFIQNGSYV